MGNMGQYLTDAWAIYYSLNLKSILALLLTVLGIWLFRKKVWSTLLPASPPAIFYRWVTYVGIAAMYGWFFIWKLTSALLTTVWWCVFRLGGCYELVYSDDTLSRLAGMGVGPTEELGKVIAGLIFFTYLTKRLGACGRSMFVVAFAVAGLGFGVGENISYFSELSIRHRPLGSYLYRVLVNVPFHTSTTIIAAAMLWKLWEPSHDPRSFTKHLLHGGVEPKKQILWAIIPSALLHGGYNVLLVNSILPLIVAAVALIWAVRIIKQQQQQVQQQVAPSVAIPA